MIESNELRDSGWRQLSTVTAGLSDYVRSVFIDGVAIGVEFDGGRCFAIKLRADIANVVRYGSGGGFCWQREMSRGALDHFLDKSVDGDPLVRRGPPQEVWPLGRR